jgi:PKD domain-containing protein/Big-like domain-containing protein
MVSPFMVSRIRPVRALVALLSVSGFITVACQKVPLLAPSGSIITLISSATTLPTGGSTEVIAQVIEPAGTPPHEGTHVTFTTTLGSIQPSEAETDIAGRAIVRFVAGNSSGTAVIGAISGGVSVASANQVKILVGSAAVGGVSVNATPSTLPNGGGQSTITATVSDTSGNLLANVPVTFAIDTSSNGTAGGTGALSATVVNTDANGRAVVTLSTTRTTTVSATAGTGTATATPAASGAQVSRVTVTVNTTNSVSIGAPSPASPQAGQTVTFPLTYGTSTTASPIIRLTVDWGDGTSQGFTGQPSAISHPYRAPGSYLIVVTGIDSIGDTTTTTSSVTVASRPALAVTIAANPAQPVPNTVVTFTITATPSSGNAITSITVDFGDGNRGTITGNAQVVQHVYTAPGQYVVTAIATDSAGNTGSASVVMIVGNFTDPKAVFTVSPSTGNAGSPFQFNGSDSTPPANIVSYQWDFGDGTTATGQTTSHSYAVAGTFTVRLTVTDSAGRTATSTQSLVVK